jgi:hypothetical protein
MATALYKQTIDAGLEPDRKAVSTVDVDGVEVQVTWWPSLIDQWGKDGVKAYLEAEALYATGNYADARAHLSGIVAEWATQWSGEHPDPAPMVPATDPLL